MPVTRSPFGVTVVPDSVVQDAQIGPLAFRLLVLLHSDTTPPEIQEGDLARMLDCLRSALDEAFRELESAGYLVRRLPSDWQVTPWA